MSVYSEKCKRTPTPEGVVPCYMCPGECVGDPATPEENERLCNEWAARVGQGVAQVTSPNPIIYEHRVFDNDQAGGTWRGPGYYFSDETWSQLHGPYPTLMAAKINLLGYLYHMDHGPFSWATAWKNLGPMWRTALWVAELPEPTIPAKGEWI